MPKPAKAKKAKVKVVEADVTPAFYTVKFHQDAGLNGKMFGSGTTHDLTPDQLGALYKSCTVLK